MATVKRHRDKWQAQIYVNGHREYRTFRLKSEAREWADKRERVLRSTRGRDRTVSDLIARYRPQSEAKRGGQWERTRLDRFDADLGPVRLSELDSDRIAGWRDDRLKSVSGATVRREMVLLNAMLNVAKKEWKWLAENPCSDVRKPSDGPPRRQRFTQAEIDALCIELGYGMDTVSGRTAAAFLFAIETACRLGELCGIRSEHIHADYVEVDGKTGYREVPLSPAAVAILEDFPNGFGLRPMQVSTAFRKAKNKLGLDVTFHDTRREATIRLSKIYNVMDLAEITGHRNLNQLRTYYKADASELAQRLSPDPQSTDPQ